MSFRFYLHGLLILTSLGCSNPPSTEDGELTIRFECKSPGNTQIATFYTLSGGGAAGWVYQYLSIRAATQPFDATKPLLTMSHGYDARLIWHDESHLGIEYPESATVLRSEPSVTTLSGQVSISYIPRPDSEGLFADNAAGCSSADIEAR